MQFAPDTTERLARARADLRMGVPVVMEGGALVLAAEKLDAARLASLRAMGGAPVLMVTSWGAQTLKARAYDGDLARLVHVDLDQVHLLAQQPADLVQHGLHQW